MAGNPKHAFLVSVEKTYGRQLRRFLAARLRNAGADTADLMQEVFLRLLRIDHYETIRHPQAYLHTIASHVLQQHALKQVDACRPLEVAAAKAQWELAVSVFDPAVELAAEQEFAEVERSLKALSPRAYTTLVLSRCHGMSLQEIGAQLGVSRAQAKKYLARALIHVRERLDQMNEDGR